jgi:peptidyl-dipeptidase Dcp
MTDRQEHPGLEQQQLHQAEGGEPVLISLDDAETMFHEFGHALHAYFARW